MILHGSSNVINTIGHEARHVFQNYKMMHNIVENKYDLFMLYDTLVDFYTKGAYWDNYYKQFAEIDARIFGYAVEEKFLNMYGYTLSSISKEKNNADMMLLAQEDTMRVIDGKEVLLENQLLSILNENLDLYDKYPQLHYEFIKNQEEIRFKTKDELVDNYILNKDKTKDQLLLELVVRGKRREELKRKNDIHNSVSK